MSLLLASANASPELGFLTIGQNVKNKPMKNTTGKKNFITYSANRLATENKSDNWQGASLTLLPQFTKLVVVPSFVLAGIIICY